MSPIFKTSRNVLDKADSLELVLEIPSFSGGENTIGTDKELKANEARTIQNWDIDSIGGMRRAEGFTEVATISSLIKPVVFTGAGLNDATSGGTYSGTVLATYTVIIDASVPSPDTFKWKKNSGSFTTGVAITGGAQTLSDGVTITFGAIDGHTVNDQWVITASVYTSMPNDLSAYHFEGTTTAVFAVAGGDLLKKNGSTFSLDHSSDVGAFTSNVLCGYVSAGNALWITNSTDNLKRKVLSSAVAAPSGVPATASDRIIEHNFRLIAEGNSAKSIYGSRVGAGNWTAADAWSASNDAWSMVMPDLTQGSVPGFPSGTDITVFTRYDTWVIYNQPNVARRRILNGIGCWNGFTVARGIEGIYFFSVYPTLGIFLWDGTQFINLTLNNDFIDDVSLTNRMFGTYRDNKYYFIYNESGSGVSYPNRLRIYDASFGRWMQRPINSSVSDNFGYPVILFKDNNELYMGSSRKLKFYDFEDGSTSDNGYNTEADYKTKVFTSADFSVNGGQFPVDYVRLKLLKATYQLKGTVGALSNAWTADRGVRNGSQTIDLTSSGDLINSTFTVNTSYISGDVPDRIVAKSFSNSAVGREFQFQILNSGSGSVPSIKNIKIHAVALEEV